MSAPQPGVSTVSETEDVPVETDIKDFPLYLGMWTFNHMQIQTVMSPPEIL